MFESVEVLKGLSGFMYGFGSPGGIVNYVTKRPTTDKSVSAALGYQEGGALKEHFDIGGRLGEEGGFGYRLNLLHEDGGVQEESGTIHRNAAGLNLEWRLSDDVALSYESLYQRRKSVGGTDVVLSTSYAVPQPIAGNSKLNSVGAGSDVEFVMYTLGMDVRVAPDWMMNLSYRTSDSTRVYKKDQYYISSDKGDYKDRVTSELHGYHFDQIQASWEGKLQKWGVRHDIVAGFSSQNLVSTSSAATPKTYLGTGNLYAPTIINVYGINWSGGTYRDEATRREAAFASDTVKLDEHWSVLAGARFNRFLDNAYNAKNALIANYPAIRTTPTVALMYKPGADATLYGSYVEAMEMSASAPASAANANQTFAPIRSKQAEADPQLAQAAGKVLARLFKPAFIRALAAGQRQAANTGIQQFTSKDGQFTSRLEGDGESVIRTPVDAALALYELYAAAADMQSELGTSFQRFMPQAQAAVFAAHDDTVSFYSKGPGLLENGAVNYAMAQPLLDDFFAEVQAVAAGDLRHMAKLRFAQAETIIPLAALLGLRGMSEQLPTTTPYSYKSSPWRGERIAPMAANIQWDSYQNDQGQIAVRMLYNEQPVDFKAACAYAKLTAESRFYDFSRLRRCYQQPG